MLKKNDIQVKTKCYYKINLIVTAIAVLMLGLMSGGVRAAPMQMKVDKNTGNIWFTTFGRYIWRRIA